MLRRKVSRKIFYGNIEKEKAKITPDILRLQATEKELGGLGIGTRGAMKEGIKRRVLRINKSLASTNQGEVREGILELDHLLKTWKKESLPYFMKYGSRTAKTVAARGLKIRLREG